MTQLPFKFDGRQRELALEAIKDACSYRAWRLYAAHVRREHIHVVVSCECKPEQAMKIIKTRITKVLRENFPDHYSRKIWTRHGSTKYIWKSEYVFVAVDYVIRKQGEPMCLYYDPQYYDLTNQSREWE